MLKIQCYNVGKETDSCGNLSGEGRLVPEGTNRRWSEATWLLPTLLTKFWHRQHTKSTTFRHGVIHSSVHYCPRDTIGCQ